jgi:hypothetical protein
VPSTQPIDGAINVALGDNWDPSSGGLATFPLGGELDKLDVLIFDGDAAIQFRDLLTGNWTPDDGMPLRAGFAQSITGIGDVYDHLGGVNAFRLKRLVPGNGAVADVRWFVL